jgi:tetratricopeptide (TPR) repeat protein
MDFEQLQERVQERLAATDLAGAAQLLERAAEEELDEDSPDPSYLWEDLADAYADRGRYDEAIATVQRCIDLELAERDLRGAMGAYHLRAGREDEAVALWDAVVAERPDDVWVPFSAGVAYLDLERPDDALPWFTQALELVVAHGDEAGLLIDLLELRDEAMTAVGEDPDDLQERGSLLFGRQVRQPAARTPFEDRREPVKAAFAWFPEEDWAEALRRWPDLAEEWGTSTYQDYVRVLQQRLLAFADEEGTRPSLAPLYVDAYVTWTEVRGEDPGESESRAAYAAEVARLGNEVPWPPGRNDPCWCGSGAKYKKCCGTVKVDA